MHSLVQQEVRAFSRAKLRKQRTRVTTVTGRRLLERWEDARGHVVEAVEPRAAEAYGYVRDLSLDLQVGAVQPWLLLGSQDAAHDLDTLKKYKVTHILNVAYGVENAFLGDFTYKNVSILDLPETNVLSYFPECFEFIEEGRSKGGVVLVHCNAGVSRAAAVVVGFLMKSEGLTLTRALAEVKSARPAACPNSGFMDQLRGYQRAEDGQ
ncbi:dual specificity protein phosphatase 19 [Ornithorhynchus anatinus]|uniref:Dual specificity protein phosphatase 19 n=1 Tax=Ornithorhynchus anatinus TaxID=9258 RepID=F6VLQ3_ORNAN|nr:dual specificity protein phosphatase 19 [Ornithorhynchus anatinus]